ncbi:MAG: hypothetical protein CBC90_06695 [Acidimicrobiaceae bacterium TMED130]|nr:MAG: hypothetical protein CBC90_06695 [Acidimicrobiaceae bacterium TMED130]
MSDTPPELIAPPWSRVEWSIMLTAREIRRSFDEVFSDFDLNLSGAALIALIVEHGPLSQSKLGVSLGMGRASAGALVDDLQKRELVQRDEDPADKRVWLVSLTKKGESLATQLEERHSEVREHFPNVVGKEERSQLADVLYRVRDNLREERLKHSKQ